VRNVGSDFHSHLSILQNAHQLTRESGAQHHDHPELGCRTPRSKTTRELSRGCPRRRWKSVGTRSPSFRRLARRRNSNCAARVRVLWLFLDAGSGSPMTRPRKKSSFEIASATGYRRSNPGGANEQSCFNPNCHADTGMLQCMGGDRKRFVGRAVGLFARCVAALPKANGRWRQRRPAVPPAKP
jgi:hypothetical protein